MTPITLDQLNTEQLRSLSRQLLQHVERLEQRVATPDKELRPHKTRNDLIETDLGSIEAELEVLAPKSASFPVRQQPKCTALPADFPRRLIPHDPKNIQCTCGGVQLQPLGDALRGRFSEDSY